MWIAASPLQTRLLEAVGTDNAIEVARFSEAELMAESEALANSPLFGEFVELLLARWHDLDNQEEAIRVVCLGLKQNASRDAFIHATDAIAETGLDDLAPFAKALDARAGDDATPLHIRVEAVAGLTRFALQSPRFAPYATSGVLRLLDAEDDWVKAKLCRLASVLHEQLSWSDAVDSLEMLTRCEACAVEARQELGFVEMANAFRSDDLVSMSSSFARSASWFEESARLAEDAPRSRMYGAVVRALAKSLTSETADVHEMRSLNEDAQWVVHYGGPRAGASWLSPPPEAELEWIPLLSPLEPPAALDVLSLLAGALQLFEKVRSVGVVIKGKREYRTLQGISRLTEQSRIVGKMRLWLRGSATAAMSSEGRARLAASIAQFEGPPGKH